MDAWGCGDEWVRMASKICLLIINQLMQDGKVLYKCQDQYVCAVYVE